MKESGNIFAVFTPVTWPVSSPVHVADPSRRTCIVSLVNAHGRPCRLQLKAGEEKHACYKSENCGPCFGQGGLDLALMAQSQSYCYSPSTFELDEKAESDAGLPPLDVKLNKMLLSGVNDTRKQKPLRFSLAELECYTLDA